MTKEELKQVVPEHSFVKFAGAKYRVAGIEMLAGYPFIAIYDEPPSDHIDLIKYESCGFISLKNTPTP